MSIFNHFLEITLTSDQENALSEIESFLRGTDDVFILKGYAGSGKTTLLKGLITYLSETGKDHQLMAPTGRAAKVLQQKTGFNATTIHSGIYSFNKLVEIEEEDQEDSFKFFFALKNNLNDVNKVFLIDESSMISNNYSEGEFFRFGTGLLLNDLITYTKVNSGSTGNKILFIGDPAQLPPVNMSFSPALSIEYLADKFKLKTTAAELKEVKRQDAGEILKTASNIRKSITAETFNYFHIPQRKGEIHHIDPKQFLNEYFSASGKKIIIAYKNKTCQNLNKRIRREKYNEDLPIQPGDQIIIGRNNSNHQVLNGEFGIVNNASSSVESRSIPIGKDKSNVELTWRRIELLIPNDEGVETIIKGYMLENFLRGDTQLSSDEQKAMFIDFRIRKGYLDKDPTEYQEALKTDPYFNPLMLKYGYAVTCHKAQGGEWENCFLVWDHDNNDSYNFWYDKHPTTGKKNSQFFRWAYTAVTRAEKCLFTFNPPDFNPYSNMTFVDIDVLNQVEVLIGKNIPNGEIVLNKELEEELEKHGLLHESLMLQDHFLNLLHLLKAKGIEIYSFKKIRYEIRYIFRRKRESASIVSWTNKKNEVNKTFQKVEKNTTSEELFQIVSEVFKGPLNLPVSRETIKSVVAQIEFDINLEETKPYLKTLYEDLNLECMNNNISIENIKHRNHLEKYYLKRSNEIAELNFHYDKKGFFTSVLPDQNKCNSPALLEKLKNIVQRIKSGDNVIQKD